MLRFKIHDGVTDDSIVLEAETIEELRAAAKYETERRGWKNCWSEEMRHEHDPR